MIKELLVELSLQMILQFMDSIIILLLQNREYKEQEHKHHSIQTKILQISHTLQNYKKRILLRLLRI